MLPKPFPKPKPQRLSKRKAMTIALVIRALDGFVVAADRQETAGDQKGEQGKITSVWKANPPACLVVTGAGDGPYLDSISTRLRKSFGESKEADLDGIGAELDALNQEFYKEKVIPISDDPNLRPNYDLLLACRSANQMAIWKTSQLAFVKEEFYSAVGIGDMTAMPLLRKLWLPVPIEEAINLAAFTIQEVKASVEGCGLGTDIVFSKTEIFQNYVPMFMEDAEIREMENLFRLYLKLERETFHYCVAHVPSVHTQDVIEKYKQNRSKMRDAFEKINDRRRELFKPSTSEMSEPRP